MKKQTARYNTSKDALEAVTKRLQAKEDSYNLNSKDFFKNYVKGYFENSEDYVEWANDFRHSMALNLAVDEPNDISVDLLDQYLKTVEDSIAGLENATVERYEEEIFAGRRANLRIRVRFSDGHLLELNEAVVVLGQKTGDVNNLDYRYHFQDENKLVAFHYDNVPDDKDPEDLPPDRHGSHTEESSPKPSVPEMVEEAKRILSE